MRRYIISAAAVILSLSACASCSHRGVYYDLPARRYVGVSTGLHRFLSERSGDYRGRHAAVVTNHSGVDSEFRHMVALLRNRGIIIDFALAPEHGIFGYKNDYDSYLHDADEENNLVVYNLHLLDRKSLRFLFRVPDLVIFDIQDMGMRCYTYISSLKLVMDALAGTGKELLVLDRPNPISFLGVRGPWLDERFSERQVSSFPSTLFYDMTPGEAARYYNGEYLKNVRLTVVSMGNYRRDLYYHETKLPWVPPSPNLPTYKSAITYTVMVLMEGINISLGRGTSNPFEFFGAPWIEAPKFCRELESLELKNFRFRPVYFKPTFSAYEKKLCGGAHIYYTGGVFDPLDVSYRLIAHIKKTYGQCVWRKSGDGYAVDRLAGTDGFRKAIDAGLSYSEYYGAIRDDIEAFRKKRSRYLLY